MQSVNICYHDTQGLANDAMVLAEVLKSKYIISIVKYPETLLYTDRSLPYVDIRIFLEHASSYMMNAKCNIFIPNIECMNSTDIRCARDMHVLVAKTKHAHGVLTKRFPQNKVEYWGWSSIDRALITNTVPDYNEFLHVKGVSRFKNTQLVLETWLKHPEWPTLTIIHYGNPNQNGYIDIPVDHFMVADNIRMIQRKTTENELTYHFNRCGVHVCPSNLEGFGHYINEALSVRALVVTTDGQPMKQFVDHGVNGFLIPPVEDTPHSLGNHYTLDTNGFENAIRLVLDTSLEQRATMGNRSREIYERPRIELSHNAVQGVLSSGGAVSGDTHHRPR